MQAGIADGTIDADLRQRRRCCYPECGAAEAYWCDIYTMPDADFVAAGQAGVAVLPRPWSRRARSSRTWCPSEFFDPPCLEGRNWYTNFDEDYNDRFYECVDAATR